MGRVRKYPVRILKIGDLVKCADGSTMWRSLDGGVGVVIQIERYDPDGLSICVQWADDALWYEEKDIEVVSESR